MSRLVNRSVLATALLLVCMWVVGCQDKESSAPDTSGISVDLRTHRFDKDLFALDTLHIESSLKDLKKSYPSFLDFFLDTLMAYKLDGNYADTMDGIRNGLIPFITYKDYRELEDYVQAQYPDTKTTDERLRAGFANMKYYFPSFVIPEIYYVNLGLSRWTSFPVDSNTLCIALDMFLGDAFPHYAAINEPAYLKQHRRATYIPVTVFSSLYHLAYPMRTQEKCLLDLMLAKGKEMYYLNKMLPGTPDSVLFGFGEKQIKWCEDNEAYIYNFFVKNQLLFSKEQLDIMSYVTDGPFARGMEPPTAGEKTTPGNVGAWLGYKMIEAYMKQRWKLTLPELLSLELNPTTFLSEAKYKPR